MPKSIRSCLIALLLSTQVGFVSAQETSVKPVAEIQGLPTRIAFGSCGNENKPQPILETVVGKSPDIFVYLGDNIYGDTRDMEILQAKYEKLGAKPEFQSLRENVAVLSIWDDHDYGENDAGKEYPKKVESEEIFLDFWAVPNDSPRRTRPGIYGAHRFEDNGKILQVILLDTRYFRDPLKLNRNDAEKEKFKNQYRPDNNPAKTLLGKDQWHWLKETLSEPADLRIICSSIQFGHEYNGWESWTNLPVEQRKMFDAIKSTKANGVVFISGDVHWGEISKRQPFGFYPIHDVTASGITETWPTVETNQFRLGEVVRDNHFGQIEVDWSQDDPNVKLQIIDLKGDVRVEESFPISDLSFDE